MRRKALPMLFLALSVAHLPAYGEPVKGRMMNHLADQKSPYLLQHAANPVDWHPWGEAAFRKAREEDKPVFLSIGYSTCHWCHVMERESFEDEGVAALMNTAFVSVKVDREERPDIDARYMAACQMLTGSGGWPLTIVMTPDGEPFFAATYIPRENAFGRMGMLELVPKIAEVWTARRAEVYASAQAITRELAASADGPAPGVALDREALAGSARALLGLADGINGGFGTAPKFPMPSLLLMLLRAWKREGDAEALAAVEKALASMRSGGIFDQIGYGFHRYSTDARWRVPHFEKMLYDQAQLAIAYTEAWQATGRELYRRTAREVLGYVQRDMSAPDGGLYCAEDADSEGEEGRYYLWTLEEVRSIVGDAAFPAFRDRYRLRPEGNLGGPGGPSSGENILYRDSSDDRAPGDAEAALLAAREKRARPFRDDKVLSGWNGLMIAAFSKAGAAFGDPALVEAGARAAGFVLEKMRSHDGRLLHRYRGGEAAIPAFADDYAYMAWGLTELYEADFDPRWLREAAHMMDSMIAHHWDAEAGGFFLTADDAEAGIGGRQKPLTDGAVPSANSVALSDLLRLAALTENPGYVEKARDMLRLYTREAADNPLGYGFSLSALDWALGPAFEVVIAGDPARDDTRAMLRALRRRFIPNAAILLRPPGEEPEISRLAPFTLRQTSVDGKATAYVCRGWQCELPTDDPAVMLAHLGEK
jgi:uncharacterized protein